MKKTTRGGMFDLYEKKETRTEGEQDFLKRRKKTQRNSNIELCMRRRRRRRRQRPPPSSTLQLHELKGERKKQHICARGLLVVNYLILKQEREKCLLFVSRSEAAALRVTAKKKKKILQMDEYCLIRYRFEVWKKKTNLIFFSNMVFFSFFCCLFFF